MHIAAAHGHDNCMKAIVYYEQGSPVLNLNVSNDLGNTPLHLAAKWGFFSIVQLLLENEASALVRNRHNQLPSFFAHNVRVLQLLNAAAKQELRLKALEVEAQKSEEKKKQGCRRGGRRFPKTHLNYRFASNSIVGST
jgi:hypothetical protein